MQIFCKIAIVSKITIYFGDFYITKEKEKYSLNVKLCKWETWIKMKHLRIFYANEIRKSWGHCEKNLGFWPRVLIVVTEAGGGE